jgi:hypothetical protein
MPKALSTQNGTDKAVRLIDYLTAVASLRSKVVRAVDQYDKVFWFDDIPIEKECFSRPQGGKDDYPDDIWIEITAAKEPPFPFPPESCKDWIDSKLLREGTPHLMESINVEISNPDHSPDNDEPETILETRNLPDYPKVSKAFDKYCADWLDWQVDHSHSRCCGRSIQRNRCSNCQTGAKPL